MPPDGLGFFDEVRDAGDNVDTTFPSCNRRRFGGYASELPRPPYRTRTKCGPRAAGRAAVSCTTLAGLQSSGRSGALSVAGGRTFGSWATRRTPAAAALTREIHPQRTAKKPLCKTPFDSPVRRGDRVAGEQTEQRNQILPGFFLLPSSRLSSSPRGRFAARGSFGCERGVIVFLLAQPRSWASDAFTGIVFDSIRFSVSSAEVLVVDGRAPISVVAGRAASARSCICGAGSGWATTEITPCAQHHDDQVARVVGRTDLEALGARVAGCRAAARKGARLLHRRDVLVLGQTSTSWARMLLAVAAGDFVQHDRGTVLGVRRSRLSAGRALSAWLV